MKFADKLFISMKFLLIDYDAICHMLQDGYSFMGLYHSQLVGR